MALAGYGYASEVGGRVRREVRDRGAAVKRRADTTYHSELMGRRYGLVVGDILTTATDAGLISSVSVQALS